jgi:hypothetical protein
VPSYQDGRGRFPPEVSQRQLSVGLVMDLLGPTSVRLANI